MSGIYVKPCACLPTCPRGDNMRRGHGWRVLVKPVCRLSGTFARVVCGGGFVFSRESDAEVTGDG